MELPVDVEANFTGICEPPISTAIPYGFHQRDDRKWTPNGVCVLCLKWAAPSAFDPDEILRHGKACVFGGEGRANEIWRDIQLVSSSTSLDVVKVEDGYGCSPMQGSIAGLWKEESVWGGHFREEVGKDIFHWLVKNPRYWKPRRCSRWFDGWMTADVRHNWANIGSNLLANDIKHTLDNSGLQVFKMASGWVLEEIDNGDSAWWERFRDHISGNQTIDGVRYQVVDRILQPGGPWRQCFGEKIPFPRRISKKKPLDIACPGSPGYPTLLVSFIPRRSVGRAKCCGSDGRSIHTTSECWSLGRTSETASISFGHVGISCGWRSYGLGLGRWQSLLVARCAL
ncbi:hypothetical protein BS47DRAFT_1362042 [Hydnum rufescens UP504]|uniref:Uncharacterized protein n=1 Tax=Hydnum rufescens UP504 TaxID=1448309 RepID=A0A9P6AXZ8_9AGAM|nr:hypothetical protein BS47DRAFT_1362042 [Hydnum rufescens UP504]